MPLPVMQWVSGQGGQIEINNTLLQVQEWRIGRHFVNPDVTNTGSGGWQEFARVLAGWMFQARATFDVNHPPPAAQQVNGIWVPTGIEAPAPLACACIFQLGASLRISGLRLSGVVRHHQRRQ